MSGVGHRTSLLPQEQDWRTTGGDDEPHPQIMSVCSYVRHVYLHETGNESNRHMSVAPALYHLFFELYHEQWNEVLQQVLLVSFYSLEFCLFTSSYSFSLFPRGGFLSFVCSCLQRFLMTRVVLIPATTRRGGACSLLRPSSDIRSAGSSPQTLLSSLTSVLIVGSVCVLQ